jgi:hypothetical protein
MKMSIMIYMLTLSLAAIAAPAHADAWDMVVVNQTGKSLRSVEFAPSPNTIWQDQSQTLTRAIIPTGGRDTAHFEKPASKCRFDLKAVFTDTGSAVWSSINVCDNSYVTIKYLNSKPTFTSN